MLFLFSFRISSPRLLSIDTHSCCHNGHFFFSPSSFFFFSHFSDCCCCFSAQGLDLSRGRGCWPFNCHVRPKKGPSQFEDSLKCSRQTSEGLQNLSLDSSGEGGDWGANGIPKNPPNPLPLGADGATVGEGQAVGQSGAGPADDADGRPPRQSCCSDCCEPARTQPRALKAAGPGCRGAQHSFCARDSVQFSACAQLLSLSSISAISLHT